MITNILLGLCALGLYEIFYILVKMNNKLK